MAKGKPDKSKPTNKTATGTTSYSVNMSFCKCGAELPQTCSCCGQKLSESKAQEIHDIITHS